MIPYTLIRSSRRTLSIQISRDGELIARAPHRLSISSIENFIMTKKDWIEKHKQKTENRRQKMGRKTYSETEIQEMKERLGVYIIPRVRELWEGKDLPKYTSIKITKSEGRWGSCSAKNGLCFSYRLGEYLQKEDANSNTNTEENNNESSSMSVSSVSVSCPFIDAIIVHELAHLREKNHQKPFWDLVYHMMSEYEDIIKIGTQSISHSEGPYR